EAWLIFPRRELIRVKARGTKGKRERGTEHDKAQRQKEPRLEAKKGSGKTEGHEEARGCGQNLGRARDGPAGNQAASLQAASRPRKRHRAAHGRLLGYSVFRSE